MHKHISLRVGALPDDSTGFSAWLQGRLFAIRFGADRLARPAAWLIDRNGATVLCLGFHTQAAGWQAVFTADGPACPFPVSPIYRPILLELAEKAMHYAVNRLNRLNTPSAGEIVDILLS